jgi:hypothetical protein
MHLLRVLLAEELGSVDHVGQGGLGLGPATGLKTAVRVDVQLLRSEVLKHLLDAVLDLLLGGNTGRVDVVDTGADVAGVLLVDEDAEQLGVGLGVLNGENISVESGNGVEEVLELRVTEVRVDLSAVGDTGGGQLEGVDGPLEVGDALGASAEGKTLTEGGLIDLDDLDASGLEVNNLVTDGESELLSLDGLVDIVTGEGPAETGDGTSEHALHGLGRHGGSVLGLLDGHGSGARDITDNDGGTHAAGAVRLNPGVGSEDVTGEALTEVLHHVVTLGLTVNEDIEVKLLLNLDDIADLGLDELLVLLRGDLTLGELVALDTDLLGLGEGTDGGGGEERELEGLGLLGKTLSELRATVVHVGSDGGLAGLDGGVVGAGRGSTSLDRLGVGLELLTDSGGALGDSLGDHSNLGGLLNSEGEPVTNLSIEGLLAGEGVGDVEEGAGGGNDDTVLAELLDGVLDLLDGGLEVGLPDVTAVNDTSGEDLLGAESGDDSVELLGVADQIDVDGVEALEVGEDIDVVDDVTEVGGEGDAGSFVTEAAELLIGRLEGGLVLLSKVEDEDGLVNLNILSTGGLELGEKLDVEGKKLVELRDGVDALATISLGEGQERDGTQDDRAGSDASGLGLVELSNGLGLSSELVLLVVLESGLDVVVVRVEPLDHLEGGDIDTLLLETTAHGEVLIDSVEVVLGVTLGDSSEELVVVEDLIVESEVVARDHIDTGILLDLPVLQTETLALSEELITGDLSTPVSFSGLLQVTELTHTGETQNR